MTKKYASIRHSLIFEFLNILAWRDRCEILKTLLSAILNAIRRCDTRGINAAMKYFIESYLRHLVASVSRMIVFFIDNKWSSGGVLGRGHPLILADDFVRRCRCCRIPE